MTQMPYPVLLPRRRAVVVWGVTDGERYVYLRNKSRTLSWTVGWTRNAKRATPIGSYDGARIVVALLWERDAAHQPPEPPPDRPDSGDYEKGKQ
jgi:hypothetical protein